MGSLWIADPTDPPDATHVLIEMNRPLIHPYDDRIVSVEKGSKFVVLDAVFFAGRILSIDVISARHQLRMSVKFDKFRWLRDWKRIDE